MARLRDLWNMTPEERERCEKEEAEKQAFIDSIFYIPRPKKDKED